MSSDGTDKYLNVRETARVLEVHENTIRNWASNGLLIAARVPGSRYLRFERAAVLKLQKDRGSAASQISPAHRTDGPELVTASELNIWAGSQDARTAFPDLMRRLLAATPGITNVEVRAYEGVAAHGWDGRASSTGSFTLPAGELRFEFGTNQDSKTKANSDYEHRQSDRSVTYIAATPRNWAGGAAWSDDRRAEEKFADVKVIDGHVIEQWLISAPDVHYWISERLGYNPRGARTIERWWSDFAAQTSPVLPSALFTAGREAQTAALHRALTSAPDGAVTVIQAPWRDEAVAFVYSALIDDREPLERTIVVDDRVAWNRLIESPAPLILVPTFDGDSEVAHALDRNHYVIITATQSDITRSNKVVTLPKVDRSAAEAALGDSFTDFDKRRYVAALARRSMPALFRELGRNSRTELPRWAADAATASIVAPLTLIGTWSNSDGDLSALESLTGRSRDEIETTLRVLSSEPDAPFVLSAGHWRLSSPMEAALLMMPLLTTSSLRRWTDTVRSVLLADDPFEGMDTAARLTATISGVLPEFSPALSKGIADGLALVATAAEELPDADIITGAVDRVVQDLLQAADADQTGRTWRLLSRSLPNLAEASPNIFMRALEQDLDRPEPTLRTMFNEAPLDPFGPSSSHPSLLWSLERLSWSPEHFDQAAGLLAKLAVIDPGGKLSNRPIESLLRISYGWIANSGGDTPAKMALVERLTRRHPEIAWPYLLGLWPSMHMTAFPPTRPLYRDWTTPHTTISGVEWGTFVHRVASSAVEEARRKPQRWIEMVPRIDDLPPFDRNQVLQALRAAVHEEVWPAELRYDVWTALRTEIFHHEKFPDADWALNAEELETYHDLADALEPDDDPRKYAYLFDWLVKLPGYELDTLEYAAELERLRHEAIGAAISAKGDALPALVRSAKVTRQVSLILAQRDDAPVETILEWLTSGESGLADTALGFAAEKMLSEGILWLQQVLTTPQLADPRARGLMMAAVPFSRTFWEQIDVVGEELEAEYWAQISAVTVDDHEWVDAIDALIVHSRQWKALELLSFMLHSKRTPSIDQIKNVFSAIVSRTDGPPDHTMSGYYAQQLLEHLETHVPDDADLPRFEFTLFPLLHNNQPSDALYRHLASDPADFIAMVSTIYRAEGEPRRTPSAQEQAIGHLAFDVLREWRLLPGEQGDGSIDGDALFAWVRAARLALSDNGRGSVGDEQIGQVLSASPVGKDRVWPAEEVRDVIDTIGSVRLDTGLHTGHTNRRGITSRDPLEGGTQERALEDRYRTDAEAIAGRWPRTARVLRGIADSYRHQARVHDLEAESWSDQP